MANMIKYNKAISKANEIDDLSDDLGKEISALTTLYTSAKTNWKGPGADEFLRQLYKLIEDMKGTKSSMSNVASKIKSTAKKIKEEEEEEEEKERNRSSLGGGGGSLGGGGSCGGR